MTPDKKNKIRKFFLKFPEIELGEYKLRDLMLKDAYGYLEMMSDPENVKYLSDEDVPTSISDTEQEIKYWGGLFYRKQSIFWSIVDSKTDEFMGTIGFNNWNMYNDRAEISYDLSKKHWRKGIMTKVLNNVLVFGYKEMDLHRIEARTMTNNEPSRKLLEKVGFKMEGIQRGYRLIRDNYEDICIYSALPSDFPLLDLKK